MNFDFILAAENGDLSRVKELANKGADIHSFEDKALRSAAKNGFIEIVKYIVRKKKISTTINNTLLYAAQIGNLEVIKYLVSEGADIHIVKEWPLRWAACYGFMEVVKYFVELGANFHLINEEALRLAASCGHIEVVKYFVELGSNIHAENDEALREAAQNGNLEVVKYLVEQGADIHAKNDEALKMAMKNGDLEIVDFLITKGADIYLLEKEEIFIYACQIGRYERVKNLVEAGANFHFNKEEPLRRAAENGHLEIVNYLLTNGADIDICMKNCSLDAQKILERKKMFVKFSTIRQIVNTTDVCGICLNNMNFNILKCRNCKNCVHYSCMKTWGTNCIYCRK